MSYGSDVRKAALIVVGRCEQERVPSAGAFATMSVAIAAGARLVVDDHRLAEIGGEPLAQSAPPRR